MNRAWLTEYREKRGLQQLEVARMAGISRSYYSSIEGGHRIAPGAVALKISKVLGCPMELFYTELVSDWLEKWEAGEVKENVS